MKDDDHGQDRHDERPGTREEYGAGARPAPHRSPRRAAPVRLLTFLLVVAVLYWGREVLVPLALALLASAVLAPLTTWFRRFGLPNVAATVVVVTLVFTALGAVGYVVSQQVLGLAGSLPRYRQNIEERIRSLRSTGDGPLGEAAAMVEDLQREMQEEEAEEEEPPPAGVEPVFAAFEERSDALVERLDLLLDGTGEPVPVRVQPPQASPIEVAESLLGPVLRPAAVFGIVLVFATFFLIYRQDLKDRLIHLAGKGQLDITTHAIDEAGGRISRYLAAHVLLNVIYAIPVGFGLWWIGLPSALLWAVLAALLRFVPYVGPWIGALLPVLLSLAVFDGWSRPLMVAGLFVALELTSNNLLEPWLYSASTGLSTVAVLLAALFWGWLWGPVGILLSVPLTVVLVVIGRHVPQLSSITVLLGDAATLSPSTRFYQRVLAGDVAQAAELAHAFDGEHGIARLSDEVLLPAIATEKREAQEETVSAASSERFWKAVDDLLHELGQEASAADEAAAEGPRLPCVHLGDDSDELGATLAAVALERSGQPARVLPAMVLLRAADRYHPQRVLLCAVAPTPVRELRRFCRSVSQRLPDAELVVALWCGGADPGAAQLERAGASEVVHTMEATLSALPAGSGEDPPERSAAAPGTGAPPAEKRRPSA